MAESRSRAWRRSGIGVGFALLTVLVSGVPAHAENSSYNGKPPSYNNCVGDARVIYSVRMREKDYGWSSDQKVQLLYSKRCRTAWGRIINGYSDCYVSVIRLDRSRRYDGQTLSPMINDAGYQSFVYGYCPILAPGTANHGTTGRY